MEFGFEFSEEEYDFFHNLGMNRELTEEELFRANLSHSYFDFSSSNISKEIPELPPLEELSYNSRHLKGKKKILMI
jgi:hypothetical protein